MLERVVTHVLHRLVQLIGNKGWYEQPVTHIGGTR